MTALPEIDPYETLGVAKDATLAEIKAAHRKLVLKCHPDKIKEESLRSQAQDQFQKVQHAYELLSDETSRLKYDQKVRLEELKREMLARGSSYSRSTRSREYRDGRIYEERVPADNRSPTEAFFEDENQFTEPPRPTSRKHEEYGSRPRSRAMDDRKKSKGVPSSSTRAAKEARDTTKATRADRAKYRTKERRREAYQKHAYHDSDTYDSDYSDRSEYYVKRPSESKRNYEPKLRPTSSSRRSESRRVEEDDDFSDEAEYKHDILHSSAKAYIRRSKETVYEPERRHRSSRSPLRYDSTEPEVSSSRRSGRSKHSSRETVRPSSSRHGSFENLESPQSRIYEKVPPMPTASTFPGPKGSSSPWPSHQPSKSSTSVPSQSRSKRESSRRSETVHLGVPFTDPLSRTTRLRSEKYDSGYASSSPTPEVPPSMEASPKPSRYKNMPEPVIVEPSTKPPPLRHARTYSPPRPERQMPVRSRTYAYTPESSRGHLYREVPLEKESKYAREVGPDIAYIRPYGRTYNDDYPRPVGRRQSAY